jgi:hypothetical protein
MADYQGFVRTAALCGLVGGTLQAIGGIVLGVMRQSPSNIDTFALGPELVFTLLQALLLVGMIGLWRSGDVTQGSRARTLGRIALGAALLSRAIFVGAELLEAFERNLANAVFGAATPLLALGMIGIGVTLLMNRRWQAWRPYTALLCGLYPFVVLFPALALSGGAAFMAIGAWSICFLLFSLAFYVETRAPGRSSVAVAR